MSSSRLRLRPINRMSSNGHYKRGKNKQKSHFLFRMADLQKVAGKKMKKRKFFKKGKPTLASKVAKLQKIVKATSSSIEWKRQYFWISNANYAPKTIS